MKRSMLNSESEAVGMLSDIFLEYCEAQIRLLEQREREAQQHNEFRTT